LAINERFSARESDSTQRLSEGKERGSGSSEFKKKKKKKKKKPPTLKENKEEKDYLKAGEGERQMTK